MRRLSWARTRFSLTSDGLLERLVDRVLGDLVEDEPPHRDLRLQHLRQVPADRLAFAVRVGGQQQFGRVLDRGLEMRDLLLLLGRHHVVGGEVALDVHAQPAPLLVLDLLGDRGGRLGQVADVPVARFDPVLGSEEAAERLGLGGRLDDDERFSHCSGVDLHIHPTGTLARSRDPKQTAARRTAHQTGQFQVASTHAGARARRDPRPPPARRRRRPRPAPCASSSTRPELLDSVDT